VIRQGPDFDPLHHKDPSEAKRVRRGRPSARTLPGDVPPEIAEALRVLVEVELCRHDRG